MSRGAPEAGRRGALLKKAARRALRRSAAFVLLRCPESCAPGSVYRRARCTAGFDSSCRSSVCLEGAGRLLPPARSGTRQKARDAALTFGPIPSEDKATTAGAHADGTFTLTLQLGPAAAFARPSRPKRRPSPDARVLRLPPSIDPFGSAAEGSEVAADEPCGFHNQQMCAMLRSIHGCETSRAECFFGRWTRRAASTAHTLPNAQMPPDVPEAYTPSVTCTCPRLPQPARGPRAAPAGWPAGRPAEGFWGHWAWRLKKSGLAGQRAGFRRLPCLPAPRPHIEMPLVPLGSACLSIYGSIAWHAEGGSKAATGSPAVRGFQWQPTPQFPRNLPAPAACHQHVLAPCMRRRSGRSGDCRETAHIRSLFSWPAEREPSPICRSHAPQRSTAFCRRGLKELSTTGT